MTTDISQSTQKKRPENSQGGAWLRGGQTVAHSFDMILELLRKVLIVYFVLFLLVWFVTDKFAPENDQLYAVMHFVAWSYRFMNFPNLQYVTVKDDAGHDYTATAKDYDNIPFIQAHEHVYFHAMWLGFWMYLLLVVAVTAGLSIWFVRHGFEKLESSEIRGQEIADLSVLMEQIREYNATVIRGWNMETLLAIGLPRSKLKNDGIIKSYLALKSYFAELWLSIKSIGQKQTTDVHVEDLVTSSHALKSAYNELRQHTDICYEIMETDRWLAGSSYGFEKRPLWVAKLMAEQVGLKFYVQPRDYISPQIADIPYPIHAQYEHTLICGGTGSGKSVAIHTIIDSVKACDDCAIVYDPDGEFIRLHYRPGKDLIFNPFDERSVGWSPYNDLHEKTDWETAAADLFPTPKTGDPYWTDATRNIYATLGDMLGAKFRVQHGRYPTIKEFIDVLIGDHEELFQNLYKTSAANALGPVAGSRADSLRSVLNTGIDRLSHLIGTKEDFSFRKWVNDPDARGILFISAPEILAESIRPILAHVATLTVTALLSRDLDQAKKTTWIILDEFASLGKIDSLRRAPERLRKFGGCMVLGMQQSSQLDALYGEDDARTILGQMRNKLILACNDDVTGERMSNMLGKREVRRIEETTSYGANNIRDGVGLAPKDTIEPVAMPEQIMRLPTCTGYLMFSPAKRGKAFPISLIRYDWKDRPKAAEKFIPHNRPNPIKAAYEAELAQMRLAEVEKAVRLPAAVAATAMLTGTDNTIIVVEEVVEGGGKSEPDGDSVAAAVGEHELEKQATAAELPGLAPESTEASLSGPRQTVKEEGSVTHLAESDAKQEEEKVEILSVAKLIDNVSSLVNGPNQMDMGL